MTDKKQPTTLQLHIHAILAGILLNGYIQGKQDKKLNNSVLYQANDEILKTIKYEIKRKTNL